METFSHQQQEFYNSQPSVENHATDPFTLINITTHNQNKLSHSWKTETNERLKNLTALLQPDPTLILSLPYPSNTRLNTTLNLSNICLNSTSTYHLKIYKDQNNNSTITSFGTLDSAILEDNEDLTDLPPLIDLIDTP